MKGAINLVFGRKKSTDSFLYYRSRFSAEPFEPDLSEVCPLYAPSNRIQEQIYLSKNINSLIVGDFIYTNSNLTATLNGNFKRYAIGTLDESIHLIVLIDSAGQIQTIENCN